MIKIIKKRTVLFLFLFIILIINYSYTNQVITINARIEPLRIYVNEEFRIIVTIESNQSINIEEYPSFKDINTISQIKEPLIEEKYEVQFLNQKLIEKYTKTVTFYLIAEEEDNILGSSFKFKINNNYHVLKDFTIPIISKSNSLESIGIYNLVSFNFEPKNIYMGQPFICEWTIFSKQDIDKINIINLPEINGAVFQKINLQNNKEIISIFDEQINKYTVLKLLVFPQNESYVFFEKFTVMIHYYLDNELKSSILTFSEKKINIKPFPFTNPNFIGLIGNYSVSYSYSRNENKSSVYYILEIVLSGNGNHKYIDFNKLNLNQTYFSVVGPEIVNDFSKVILTYFLYPKQTGLVFFNQVYISIFNPDKREYDNIIIPKSSVYINQSFEQVINNYNFNKINFQYDNNNKLYIFDYIEILPTTFIIITLIIIIFIFSGFLLFIFYYIKPIQKKTEKDLDLISSWNTFTKINKIQSENELDIWCNKQRPKIRQFIHKTYEVYKSMFLEEKEISDRKNLIKLSKQFSKYLRKNKNAQL